MRIGGPIEHLDAEELAATRGQPAPDFHHQREIGKEVAHASTLTVWPGRSNPDCDSSGDVHAIAVGKFHTNWTCF